MTEEVSSRPVTKREAEVLSDASLLLLAHAIGKQDLKGIELAMYLNIPTTTIINKIAEVTHEPLTREGSEHARTSVAAKCIILWKTMTQDCKTREKIRGLEKALRELGKPDVADMLLERHSANQELTSDIFG